MAGGKMSARQKMINLMYLVFIAMLALNMDKKVLSSFGFMKESFSESNTKVQQANSGILKNLSDKAYEQPEKYKELNEKARKLSKASDDLYKYLTDLQTNIEQKSKLEDLKDYEAMDSEEAGDLVLFGKDENPSAEGKKFISNINTYRETVLGIIGKNANGELIDQINKRFSTADEKVKDGKKMIPWLNSRFKRFPLIATLTNIEKMKADIKATEADVYNVMLGGKLEEEVSLSNYTGIVALDKTAFFAGETVTGKIVMGRFDDTFVPDRVNTGGLSYTIESGQVKLNFRAGNPGSHPIKGSFVFKQKDGTPMEVPFESEYTVITEPSQAVISADKMNVVYRGLDNPLSISVPGVGDNNLSVSAPGLSKIGNGKYMINPTTGSEINISVSAKLSSGKTVNTSKLFRIKNVPPPTGAIRGQTGNVGMPKESIANATVGVVLPDFVFDLTFAVTGFSIKVPGENTIVVDGPRMDSRAQTAIAKAKRGDIISIFAIKSKVIGEGAGLPVKEATGVNIEVK